MAYDPCNRRQSMERKTQEELETKKAHVSKSKVKAILIAVFDCHGLITKEWVATGQTVNVIYYCDIMCKLHKWIRKKRTELWKNDFVIHHNNVPAHTAYILPDFLAKNRSTCLEHSPYSPDLSPSNFFPFPEPKKVMKGHHLGTVTGIKAESSCILKEIPAELYRACFHAWKQCMH